MRPQAIDKIRKKLHKVFNDIGLTITVETTLSKVNFLDVTFDLNTGTHETYSKSNDLPLYVHTESNHPPNVINNIPLAVNKRLASLSSNKHLFDKHKSAYQHALYSSKHKHKLSYSDQSLNKMKERGTPDPTSPVSQTTPKVPTTQAAPTQPLRSSNNEDSTSVT